MGCSFCVPAAPAPAPARARVAPVPAPVPTPVPTPAYIKQAKTNCGWSGACLNEAQSWCYKTSDDGLSFATDGNGYSKVMDNVARDEAESICGKICSECDGCNGFTWIGSLHGVTNACWFRQKPDCGVKPNQGRDCYTSATYGS